MKALLFSNWDVIRLLRISIGFFCIGDALIQKSMLTAGIGSILLYQGIFNKGCCSAPSCTTEVYKSDSKIKDDTKITFEEVTLKK